MAGQSRFHVGRPNQLWVADISYLRCWEDVLLLAFVLDAFGRMSVGWQLAGHVRTTLKMALGLRGPGADLRLALDLTLERGAAWAGRCGRTSRYRQGPAVQRC